MMSVYIILSWYLKFYLLSICGVPFAVTLLHGAGSVSGRATYTDDWWPSREPLSISAPHNVVPQFGSDRATGQQSITRTTTVDGDGFNGDGFVVSSLKDVLNERAWEFGCQVWDRIWRRNCGRASHSLSTAGCEWVGGELCLDISEPSPGSEVRGSQATSGLFNPRCWAKSNNCEVST